ncbi:perforin-1-like [Heterodontus francisci]|uniref:perforin-1-like n=1 Tax=Heterodontus francisci TaxID=7792 RepID=UPI00355AD304
MCEGLGEGLHTWSSRNPSTRKVFHTLLPGAAFVATMPRGKPRLARLLFLFLSVAGARSACNTGSAKECEAASFVPGASVAGAGYDLVTLQPKGAFVIDVNTWRTPDGTCTLCSNRLLSNVRQRLPLSLVDWRVRQVCKRSLSSRLFRSAAELGESAKSVISNDWRADLEVRPKPNIVGTFMLAGSKSKLVDFGTKRSKSDKYSFTSHEFRCRYYQYRVKDKPLLAAQFAHTLASLPNVSHAGTKYYYQKLVSTYGTHFIKAVDLGGRLKDVTAIRSCQAASEGYTVEEVKDCLEMEASGQVGIKVKGSTRYKKCKELIKSMKHKDSFHQEFNDRETEVTGGKVNLGVDLLFSDDSSAFTRWADSLPANPGMVSYRLEPLHHLLPRDDPRHGNLQRYISDYIMANALSQDCSRTVCPSGSHPGRRDPCSCFCHEDSRVDRLCCSKEKGLGRLTVTVKQGHDLWGDYITATDGYVIVRYGQNTARTPVRSNNNNPTWNTRLDLGEVKAESGHKLVIEVWDRDYLSRDDRLGTCKRRLTSGPHNEICYLQYGSVTFDYSFTCGPYLGGPTCQHYVPRPDGPGFTTYLGVTRSTLGPVSPVPSPTEESLPSVVFP